MGFSSQDDLITEITTNGKAGCNILQKTISVAQVAGQWTDLSVFAGLPVANAYSGSSLTYVATTDADGHALYHGGNVSSDTKHVTCIGGSIGASGTGAPWYVMMVDMEGYVPITGADVTGTSSRTVTMTALGAGSRNVNGVGLRMYFSTTTAPLTGGPNLTAMAYLDEGGNSSTVPVTVGFAATPVAGAVPHSGNAATRYGPFLPMAAGDTGITDIQSFTLSGGTAYTGTGVLAINLVRPLAILPIPTAGTFSLMDFVNMVPSLPRIRDGACLKFLLYNTGATAVSNTVTLTLDYAYG